MARNKTFQYAYITQILKNKYLKEFVCEGTYDLLISSGWVTKTNQRSHLSYIIRYGSHQTYITFFLHLEDKEFYFCLHDDISLKNIKPQIIQFIQSPIDHLKSIRELTKITC